MRQSWVLQGRLRTRPNGGWHILDHGRTRNKKHLSATRRRAKRLGLHADYRMVLVDVYPNEQGAYR